MGDEHLVMVLCWARQCGSVALLVVGAEECRRCDSLLDLLSISWLRRRVPSLVLRTGTGAMYRRT